MPTSHFVSPYSDVDLEQAITALILSPSVDDAVEVMRAAGYQTTARTLEGLLRTHSVRERYEKRRDELAPMKEGIFANDLLDNAARATLVIGLAIKKTQELLEAGLVGDPARVARDLSQVVAQSTDKRLAVQGRPTQITEHRDVGEIVRALEAMKVVQVIAGTEADDDATEVPVNVATWSVKPLPPGRAALPNNGVRG